MTNTGMFLRMLFSAVFRRRSRAVMAVVASLVGAATLFCLAMICIAVPQQMNQEMRAYGANLIVTPAAESSDSATSDSATSDNGDMSGMDMSSGTSTSSSSGASSSGTSSSGTSKSGIGAAMVEHTSEMVAAKGSEKHATYRYENVRVNAAPYVMAGVDPAAVRNLNHHWVVDGKWPSAGRVLVGRDVADAMGLTVGSGITIGYRASDNAATASGTSSSSATGSDAGTSSSSSAPSAEGAGSANAETGGASADGQSSTDSSSAPSAEGAGSANAETGGASTSDQSGDTQSDQSGTQTQDGRVSSDIMDTSGTEFRVAGIVDTGGSEDSIIYATNADVTKLTGVTRGVDVIEYSSGASDLAALVQSINDMTSMHVKAQQVTKITASDTRIITMLQTLFWIVSLVVLVLTLVGVGTTISSIVSQRRNEIGLRKALGASSRAIGVEFYVESALYGLIGGLLGTALGFALASWLCVAVFERAVGFNWGLGVASVVLAALVAVVASIPPVHRATRIDPAVVLREE
ncbi:FtsX-like permease family protein [Bifidobacterium leontopitheci]|uniref:ABC transporter permease n=1 Tax=Bifidobacterium leontopitheci TaxID=2650774 RepID=A0A6I1GIR5_9BIFI|nr:FtsX-like permease family protein [Bifidobacterium leontopitheci]KAB7790612.1 ABC transporter permease [Bifidobacterium leontopitheci]